MTKFSRAVTLIGALLVALIFTIANVDAAQAHQPYGGCKEAIDYPRSKGADHCRRHGWTITRHIVVTPKGRNGNLDRWVLAYRDLPVCETEDQEYGPCRWNFGFGMLPNVNEGKAFWVSKGGTVHYVKGLAR